MKKATPLLLLMSPLLCQALSFSTTNTRCNKGAWNFRAASDEDVELLSTFLGKLRAHFTDSTSQLRLHSDGATIQSLLPQVPNCRAVFLFDGNMQEQPIGFATYGLLYRGFGSPVLHMEHLFVDPDSRSQGAGIAIMHELAIIANNYRCTQLEWNVDKTNDKAIRFYQKLGAVQTGETDSGRMFSMKWNPS